MREMLMANIITSNFFSSSENFWSLTVSASSTISPNWETCVSKVLKKLPVIWENDLDVVIVLQWAYKKHPNIITHVWEGKKRDIQRATEGRRGKSSQIETTDTSRCCAANAISFSSWLWRLFWRSLTKVLASKAISSKNYISKQKIEISRKYLGFHREL